MHPEIVVGACIGVAIVVAIALVARHRRRGGRISPWWAIGPWWVFLSVIYLVTVFDKQTNADYDLSCPLPGQDSSLPTAEVVRQAVRQGLRVLVVAASPTPLASSIP